MSAYCPKCREDIEVPWDAPPYSVAHVGDDDTEIPQHLHPVTRELVPAIDAVRHTTDQETQP